MPNSARDQTATSPASGAVEVTPADSDLARKPCKGIYVGVSGDVTIQTAEGVTITFANVPVGFMPVRANQIRSTLTTATNIVALY